MVTLYSTGCPQCEVLKKKLDAANIDYTCITDTSIMQSEGFTVVPILKIDGETNLNFSEAIKWLKEQ